MLGGGVGDGERTRRVRRDRTVVDDAPAARILRLHHADGGLRAQEHASQVGVDHLAPDSDGQLLDRHRRRAAPGIVEQHVQPAVFALRRVEELAHGLLVRHIRGHHQRPHAILARRGASRFQRFAAAAGQHDPITLRQEFQRHRAAYAGTGAGDQRHARVFDLVRLHRILLVIDRRNATRIVLAMLQAKVPAVTLTQPSHASKNYAARQLAGKRETRLFSASARTSRLPAHAAFLQAYPTAETSAAHATEPIIPC